MTDASPPALVVFGGLCLASLLVWMRIVRRLIAGLPAVEPCDRPRRPIPPLAAAVAGAWVSTGLLGLLLVPAPRPEPPTVDDVHWLSLLNGLLFLAVFLPLIRGRLPEAADWGFHLRDWRRQVCNGVLGFLASVLPVFGAWLLTLPWRDVAVQHGLLRLLEQDHSLPTLAAVLLSAVLLAPLVEELTWRVVLQSWLERISPPREALAVVALMFSAVHRLPDAVPLLPLALILGYLYQQRGSVLTIVTVHLLFNASNLGMLLLIR